MEIVKSPFNYHEIQPLKKSFGDNDILCGLDLSVPEHSVFEFVGRNGSGKTTTMKAVLGLLKPDVPEFYSYMTSR